MYSDNINWLCPVNWHHPLNRGLVSWWLALPNQPGWGSSQWLDLCDPLYGNIGTLTNMVPATDWVIPSDDQGGRGEVDFDGTDDSVVVGDPASLAFAASPLSIVVWAYDRAGGNSVITKGQSRGVTTLRTFDLFDTGSQLRWHGIHTGGASWAVDTTTRPALNTWNCFVATWNGTTDTNAAALHVNGALVGQSTPTTASLTTGTEWNIGGNGNNSSWDGLIADVRIYRRVLTAAEVARYHIVSRLGYPGLLNRIEVPRVGSVQGAVNRKSNLLLLGVGA